MAASGRKRPLLNRGGDDPLDLGAANRHWKREFRAPSDWFHFGASRWSHEENVGFFLEPGGAVVALLKSGAQVVTWLDFQAFLAEELERAERVFPERETAFAAMVARYRDKPAPSANWLKRLFFRRLSLYSPVERGTRA